MAKKGKVNANKNKEVRREMMEGELKKVADEDLVINQPEVDNGLGPTQGFLNPVPKPPPADGELKDAHYTEAKEGDDEEKEAENEDGDDSPEQEEEGSTVRYFYDNEDEETGKRVGCTFVNMSVHARGDVGYALVGPTDNTGGCIVCGSCVLYPADPEACGVDDVIVVTRAHVLEMSRGPNYQFMFAKMDSVNDTDSEGVVTSYT
jgi:hypothetical protein